MNDGCVSVRCNFNYHYLWSFICISIYTEEKISSHNGLFLLVFLTMGLVCIANLVLMYFEVANAFVIPVAIAQLFMYNFDSRVGIVP